MINNIYTAVSAAASHSRKAFLDLAWERINALGGVVGPYDHDGQIYNKAIGDALDIIEELKRGED